MICPVLVAQSESDVVEAYAAPAGDDDIAHLTRRLVDGEEEAYREFHARYFHRLLRYLLVLHRGDEHAAQEAVQQTFVKVVRHVRRFQNEAVWWSWLALVARSCVIDGERKKSRYRALLERYAGSFAEVGGPAPAEAEEHFRTALAFGLDQLDPEERTLIEARYYDGESLAALASRAGCTEKAMHPGSHVFAFG